MGGPCTSWATVTDAQAFPDLADLDEDILLDGLTVASEVLYRLSGRQYAGVCTDVVRPCRRGPNMPLWWRWNTSWGVCSCGWDWGQIGERSCGCGRLSEITLGANPIREITEVRIDGAVLDPAAYRVDDRRRLVRIDGLAWPWCQDLTADPLTDVDTFQVTFTWGQAPPRMGVLANAELGGEIAKAIAKRDNCRLPTRVISIASQGITTAVLDPMKFLDDGKTGLYLVDLFLTSVNPHQLQRRAQVISPDIGRPVRRTAVTPGS